MINSVVLAGAGPNGLMLACELALAGVRPIVLERLAEPSDEPRANGLVGQVVKLLDRRDLYERLSGSAEPPRPSPAHVFGALRLDLQRLEDNPLHVLPVPQHRITEVLTERANELGVEIRRGHALLGLSQQDDAVTLDVAGPNGDYPVRTRYLVGADGGHSAVRKLSGIDFPGVSTDRAISRTARVSLPAEWVSRSNGTLDVPGYGTIPPFQHHRNECGLFVFAPFPGQPPTVSTVEWDQPETVDRPMTLDEMGASVGRVLGIDVAFGPPQGEGPHLLRRVIGGNTRLADRFRDRRVLLVGDAAHVHSAIGGPGLNLGLQDTVNLGWKLAATIRGGAPAGLLDTYEAERRPVAQRVVMHTQAQSALIAPGSDVTALRELFTELLDDPGTLQHLADLMAGADIRYPMTGHDAHPLIGRWAPDLSLETEAGSVRLSELTRGARPLLLDLTQDSSPARALAADEDRVDIVTARSPTARAPATALLLRPDCHVAWATSSPQPDAAQLEALVSATQDWFAPSRVEARATTLCR